MVDVFLIVVAVIVPILILIFSFYVLVYYQHPDDNWTDYFPKAIVVLGLSVALISVVLLPFDVANGGLDVGCGTWNNNCGGLDLYWLWPTVYLVIAAFIVLIIPFTMFFYESWEPGAQCCSRVGTAACFQGVTLIIWAIAIGVCYNYFRFVDLPVVTYSLPAGGFQDCNTSTDPSLQQSCGPGAILNVSMILRVSQSSWVVPPGNKQTIEIEASFLVYIIGFLGFISWIFFSVYTGIGLATLPLSLWRAFYYRPKFMPRDLYVQTKKDIAKRASELQELGKRIREETEENPQTSAVPLTISSWKRKTAEKKLFNQFKQEVQALEDDFEDLQYCHENWKGYNPLIPWCKLVLSIISFILTLVWVLHIILYMLARDPYPNGVPVSYFLNTAFSWASKQISFALLGVILVGIFTLYLLFCALEGTARLGLRFLIVEIHPLKVGATYMTSLLFNVSLLLLCVPALLQFCSAAFADYIVLTDASLVFSVYVRNMRFFRYFFDYNVFVFVLLGVMVLAGIFVYCCITDRNMKTSVALRERIIKFEEQKAKNGVKTQPPSNGKKDTDKPTTKSLVDG